MRFDSDKLITSQNSAKAARLVRSAAAQRFGRGRARLVYEHGQWWVIIDSPADDWPRNFSAVDADPGIGATGVDFEEV